MKIRYIISVVVAVFIGLLIGVFSEYNSKISSRNPQALSGCHGARSVSDSEYFYVSYEGEKQESEIIIYAMKDKLTKLSRISYEGNLASLYQQGRYLFAIYQLKENTKLLVIDILHREKPVEKYTFDLKGQVIFQEEMAGTLGIFTQTLKEKGQVQSFFQYSLSEKQPDKLKHKKTTYHVVKKRRDNLKQNIFPFDRNRNLVVKINRRDQRTGVVTLSMMEESSQKLLFEKKLVCFLGTTEIGQCEEQVYLQDIVVDHQRKYIGLAVFVENKVMYHLYQYSDIDGFQLTKEVETKDQEPFMKNNGIIGGMLGKMHGNTLYVLGVYGKQIEIINI